MNSFQLGECLAINQIQEDCHLSHSQWTEIPKHTKFSHVCSVIICKTCRKKLSNYVKPLYTPILNHTFANKCSQEKAACFPNSIVTILHTNPFAGQCLMVNIQSEDGSTAITRIGGIHIHQPTTTLTIF